MSNDRGFVGGMRLAAVANDRNAVDALLRRPLTADELGQVLGVQGKTARTVIKRLRDRGVPIETNELFASAHGAEVTYRVIFPAGRVCAHPGCGTILRRTNPADHCELHGGGTTDALYADWGPVTETQLPQPRHCPRCHQDTTDFAPSSNGYCRDCNRIIRRAWYAAKRQQAATQEVAS